ncbi:MAG: hypothetical protein AVDCRST_MAG58-2499, partial [uncultured Rubrobacteraceae bacterium]
EVVFENGAAREPGAGGDASGQRVRHVGGDLPGPGPDIPHGPAGGAAGSLPPDGRDHARLHDLHHVLLPARPYLAAQARLLRLPLHPRRPDVLRGDGRPHPNREPPDQRSHRGVAHGGGVHRGVRGAEAALDPPARRPQRLELGRPRLHVPGRLVRIPYAL